ncbi:MAG: methyltransferase domain-containing protein [Hyphomicrobiaceae bacterium]
MRPDVTELMEFYSRPLGGMVRRILAHRIRARWRRVPGATLIGLGFATPYLGSFRGEAARLGAFMPTTQGALVWPSSGAVHTVVVEDDSLPLPDNSVDHLLAIHAIEAADNVRGQLREMWRVLKPEGRLLLIVPNRRGVWARLDTTPFGHGQPYNATQLERLLKDALFTPIDWSAALHMPPFDRRIVLRSAMSLEKLGNRMSPAFAGVIIVEAQKELLSPIGGRGVPAKALPQLVPSRGLAGSSRDDASDG